MIMYKIEFPPCLVTSIYAFLKPFECNSRVLNPNYRYLQFPTPDKLIFLNTFNNHLLFFKQS